MHDQAEKLRLHMLKSQGKIAKSIAIVSGKGGVGKSNFSMNFACMLGELKKKVVIVDMDLGMGNIHILLGKSVPRNLKDYLEGKATLEEVMFDGPNGIQYISGGSGLNGVVEWTDEMYERLIVAFEALQQQTDFILFDMGAGATNKTLDLIVAVDEVIVISTAEPTSITDAYSMMKYIYYKDASKDFYLVCNRAFTPEEGKETTTRLSFAMKKFLEKEVVILGSLPEDDVVRKAVREQIPFSIRYPEASITRSLKLIATKFVQNEFVEEPESEGSSSNFIQKLRGIFSRGRSE
ncbi:MinD/ParA family protein [Paenisporosarcina cavernae]|uniref:MinD/ParA family protein n=1 Tax=Paenisporosarcina cavernae TaxID=2320858 RepID=A0A385YRA5_9BACL|nr:MinD/ParA family protein [Paenisporosarcina cavernae]AYC29259.1 MinD/ParA family protein [Paenisporosarcina cavernae]